MEMVLAYLTIWLLKVYPVMTLFLMSTSCHNHFSCTLHIFHFYLCRERYTGLVWFVGSGRKKEVGNGEENVRKR